MDSITREGNVADGSFVAVVNVKSIWSRAYRALLVDTNLCSLYVIGDAVQTSNWMGLDHLRKLLGRFASKCKRLRLWLLLTCAVLVFSWLLCYTMNLHKPNNVWRLCCYSWNSKFAQFETNVSYFQKKLFSVSIRTSLLLQHCVWFCCSGSGILITFITAPMSVCLTTSPSRSCVIIFLHLLLCCEPLGSG